MADLSSSSFGVDAECVVRSQWWRPRDRHSFTQTLMLPGGYVDEAGVVSRDVELAPVTGFDEELLDSVGPAVSTAAVVTALLSKCVKRIGRVHSAPIPLVRDLVVGDREYLMLRLRELTLGKRINAVLRCGNPECGQVMDVAFSLDDLRPSEKPLSQSVFKIDVVSEEKQFEIEFRLPTGAHQEAAANWTSSDDQPAVINLLALTITKINGSSNINVATVAALPEKVLKAIELRMEELAPLHTTELNAVCVECKQPFVSDFDVTSFFLAELQQHRRVLEREVHCIAWHYHWPEHEILSLTRAKRRRYIDLIQQDSSTGVNPGFIPPVATR